MSISVGCSSQALPVREQKVMESWVRPGNKVASFPGAEEGEKERLVHTVCACA